LIRPSRLQWLEWSEIVYSLQNANPNDEHKTGSRFCLLILHITLLGVCRRATPVKIDAAHVSVLNSRCEISNARLDSKREQWTHFLQGNGKALGKSFPGTHESHLA
jgi:hypothetical protein